MDEVKEKDLQEGPLGQELHTLLETSSLQIWFLFSLTVHFQVSQKHISTMLPSVEFITWLLAACL